METFEIVAFEYQDAYSRDDCQRHEVVEKFVEKYCEYFDPAYYTEPSIIFDRGKFYLSYRDDSGGDKPILLMLIGPITDILVAEIKAALRDMYNSLF
jgi:hypothetical protein